MATIHLSHVQLACEHAVEAPEEHDSPADFWASVGVADPDGAWDSLTALLEEAVGTDPLPILMGGPDALGAAISMAAALAFGAGVEAAQEANREAATFEVEVQAGLAGLDIAEVDEDGELI